MKSFLEFLIENYNDMNFLYIVDRKGNFATAPSHLDHETAFKPLYFGYDTQTMPSDPDLLVPVWGRVENGVATIVTHEGAEPPSFTRNKRTLEDDIFDRIHAIQHLKNHTNGNIMFHAGVDQDRNPIRHSPIQHEKHLTGFLARD